MPKTDENKLWAKVCNGDKQSLELLYNTYSKSLYLNKNVNIDGKDVSSNEREGDYTLFRVNGGNIRIEYEEDISLCPNLCSRTYCLWPGEKKQRHS
jgi:hypothetical protein